MWHGEGLKERTRLQNFSFGLLRGVLEREKLVGVWIVGGGVCLQLWLFVDMLEFVLRIVIVCLVCGEGRVVGAPKSRDLGGLRARTVNTRKFLHCDCELIKNNNQVIRLAFKHKFLQTVNQ